MFPFSTLDGMFFESRCIYCSVIDFWHDSEYASDEYTNVFVMISKLSMDEKL